MKQTLRTMVLRGTDQSRRDLLRGLRRAVAVGDHFLAAKFRHSLRATKEGRFAYS